MCDYSLLAIPNRLAVEGEELVTHRFPTGSMGMASSQDVRLCEIEARNRAKGAGFWKRVQAFFTVPASEKLAAVCLPPGARLRLHGLPADLRRFTASGEEAEVSFVQTSAEPHTYRDAVRFECGRTVRLQDLPAGLRADVLTLGSQEREEFVETPLPHAAVR